MAIDTADFKETSLPGSSNNSNNATASEKETEDRQQRSGSLNTEDDEVGTELPLQYVRTLGKLRFRPADDDEPQ